MMNTQPQYRLVLVLTGMLIASCQKDIDIAPIANNTSNAFYANEFEVKQAVTGIYARLGRNGTNTDFATDYFLLASENRSDLLYLAGETSAQNDQLELRKYLISPTSGTVSGIFSRLYQMVKEANNLLFYTKEGTYMRYRAEASFLRAYAYSELARSFGAVALVTKPIENQEAVSLPRAPLSEIYSQIIADLNYAAASLQNTYTGAEAGRVGKLAARALLGQVYMTMAGYPYNDTGAYARAEEVYTSIISDVQLRFGPSYAGLFTLANENKYDLFSIQFASGGLGTGSSLPGYITSSSSSGSPFPEWVYTTYTQQGQDIRVDSLVVNAMKGSGDLRFSPTIAQSFYSAVLTPANANTRTLVSKNILIKFLEKDNTNVTIRSWNDFPRNFPIIRDSDVILMYAEALIRNGKAGEAKTYIDQIRKRAGLASLEAAPTMDDVKRERKYEFIGEGRRYFDLVRWGDVEALQTLQAFAARYHANTNGQAPSRKDLLLPIPQNELKTRSNWEQNPGY